MTESLDMPGYKEHSVRVKFLQQMFLGVGGATVFGLVGALSMGTAAVGLFSGLLIGAVGIGCMYMGSMYLASSVQLDQDNQARKIGILTQLNRGAAVAVETPAVTTDISLPKATPLGVAALADEAPQKPWAERFEKADKADNWVSKSQAAEPTGEALRA